MCIFLSTKITTKVFKYYISGKLDWLIYVGVYMDGEAAITRWLPGSTM